MEFITFLLFLLAATVIAANLFALYWFGAMLLPLVGGGGPYVPTRPEIMQRMMHIARIQRSDVVADLGSGDGRLILAAMRAGAAHGIGYEIHPGLARLSKRKLRKAGYADTTSVFTASMWGAELSGVTLVFLYQIPYAMGRLKKLLESQLTPGSRVVSHAFKIPDWEPDATQGNVLLYKIKDRD